MSRLGDYLKASGFTVVDDPIPATAGTFPKVRAVIIHHFVGPEDPNQAPGQAAYLKRNNGQYPPPYAQLFVGMDLRVYIISKATTGQTEPGKANQAGAGIWPANGSVLPRDEGNTYSIGIEFQNTGYNDISGPIYDLGVTLSAALCRFFDLPVIDANGVPRVIGHKEYGKSQGKVDPRNNMDIWRRDTQRALTTGADVALSDADAKKIADAVWAKTMSTGWQSDGTYNANKPIKKDAAWFFMDLRGMVGRLLSPTTRTHTDDELDTTDA